MTDETEEWEKTVDSWRMFRDYDIINYDRIRIDDIKSFIHHQLQKAREELLEEMNAFTFEACPYEGTMMRAFIRSKRTDPLPTQVTE